MNQNSEEALRHLCAELVRAPQNIVKVHSFPIVPMHYFEAHSHPDLLQIDLALNGAGQWIVEGQSRLLNGVTLTVFYPGELHTYDFQPRRAGARMLSLKVRVEPTWPAIAQRIFSSYVPNLSGCDVLIRSWERLILSCAAAPQTSVLQMVRLVELLCLCPRDDRADSSMTISDECVEKAMLFIEQNLHRLLTLDEIAQQVHVSPRHLVRRFQAASGRTPQNYADARHLATAQELLVQHMLSVSDVAHALGFSSVQSFSRWFKTRHGIAPSQFFQSK